MSEEHANGVFCLVDSLKDEQNLGIEDIFQFFQTLLKVLQNVKESPTISKYRILRKNNEKIQQKFLLNRGEELKQRIVQFLTTHYDFIEHDDSFELSTTLDPALSTRISFLEDIIESISSEVPPRAQQASISPLPQSDLQTPAEATLRKATRPYRNHVSGNKQQDSLKKHNDDLKQLRSEMASEYHRGKEGFNVWTALGGTSQPQAREALRQRGHSEHFGGNPHESCTSDQTQNAPKKPWGIRSIFGMSKSKKKEEKGKAKKEFKMVTLKDLQPPPQQGG